MRVRAVALLVPIALLLAAWPAGALARSEAERPNILLIVAEDLSPRLGAYGDPVARTPALDAFAAQGVRYTRAFTASGVCAPSRAALITGMHPHTIGAQHMRTSNRGYLAVPPSQIKAFPELLRRVGYATANVVKTDYQFGEPFTVWDANVGNYGTGPDLAVWRQLPSSKPFFAMITLMSTHESRLVTAETTAPESWQRLLDGVRKLRAATVRALTDPESVEVPPYYPDVPSVRASIAQHYDNMHFMDSEVATILANLEADGLAENTLVIFTTDHGDGLPRAKRSVFDSGLHVPLLLRYPNGYAAGTRSDRLVSFVDFAPTLLHLAGAAVPPHLQGVDFLSPAPPREFIYAGRDRMDSVPDHVRAVRDARFKLIRNYRPRLPYYRPLLFRDMFPVMRALWDGRAAGTLRPPQQRYFEKPRPREALYDTREDPHELTNLIGEVRYAPQVERLREALNRWLNALGDSSARPEEALMAQAWPGGEQPVTAAPVVTPVRDRPGYWRIESATPGASIGYRLRAADDVDATARWALYQAPVAVPDDQRLEAKAIRYGYAESSVVQGATQR